MKKVPGRRPDAPPPTTPLRSIVNSEKIGDRERLLQRIFSACAKISGDGNLLDKIRREFHYCVSTSFELGGHATFRTFIGMFCNFLNVLILYVHVYEAFLYSGTFYFSNHQ